MGRIESDGSSESEDQGRVSASAPLSGDNGEDSEEAMSVDGDGESGEAAANKNAPHSSEEEDEQEVVKRPSPHKHKVFSTDSSDAKKKRAAREDSLDLRFVDPELYGLRRSSRAPLPNVPDHVCVSPSDVFSSMTHVYREKK
jgi:hypothetical protein